MDMPITLCLVSVLSCLVFANGNHLSGRPVKARIDNVFQQFMESHDFYGGQLGIIHGSRLVYAEARGSIHGKQASTDDLIPILDLSKSITAVAILQLVEQGYIDLDMKIFGEQGILYYFNALPGKTVDARMYDITIEHLLRHSGGWDETARPLLDPIMNKAKLALGYQVPDISKDLGYDDGHLDVHDVIEYVFSEPLHFSPGQRSVHSNLGYCILGRVIEAVTGQYYENYVKQNILEPAGMWHTKLGPGKTHSAKVHINIKEEGKLPEADAYNAVPKELLESTLGWYSNVYDIARFFTALYSSDELLIRQVTLNYAMQRNPEIAQNQDTVWPVLGLNAQQDGSLMLDESSTGLGVNVLFYKEPMVGPFGDEHLDRYLLETNTAIVFIGFSNSQKKHLVGLHDSILSLNLHVLQQNAYIRDLCDIELTVGETHILTKSQLDEHKLVSYSNAMRLAGFFPTWLRGYNQNGHTYFLTIFQRAVEPIDLQYRLKKTASKVKLYRFVSSNAKNGFQVADVQSVHSASHSDNLVHLVLMKRTTHRQPTMFNFNSNYQTYEDELPYYKIEGYQPLVQSIDRDQRQTYVSYILQKSEHGEDAMPETHSFANLSLDQLKSKVDLYAGEGFVLTYLDTYEKHVNDWRFSAIFTQSTLNVKFQADIPYENYVAETFESTNQGFLPKLAVPYMKDSHLFYAVVWQNYTMV